MRNICVHPAEDDGGEYLSWICEKPVPQLKLFQVYPIYLVGTPSAMSAGTTSQLRTMNITNSTQMNSALVQLGFFQSNGDSLVWPTQWGITKIELQDQPLSNIA